MRLRLKTLELTRNNSNAWTGHARRNRSGSIPPSAGIRPCIGGRHAAVHQRCVNI